jgi:hypothetical protein
MACSVAVMDRLASAGAKSGGKEEELEEELRS